MSDFSDSQPAACAAGASFPQVKPSTAGSIHCNKVIEGAGYRDSSKMQAKAARLMGIVAACSTLKPVSTWMLGDGRLVKRMSECCNTI